MNANEDVTVATVDPVIADKLMADLRMLVADMEQLLKITASQTGERVARVRAKAEESLNIARARVADLQEAALAKSQAVARATDAYVHTNPWQAVAVGAVAGLVLALILGRGADRD
jgi:ElaB/YqjD/DUF883 family membrane-anchored ribosome-binding protein